MNNAIQHIGGAIARQIPQRPENTPMAPSKGWDGEQLEVITNLIAPGCTPVELALFSEVCKKTGLDPFSRQIYAIKRGGKMTIQTSIDGFRAIAETSGDYAGNDEPIFDGALTLAQHIQKTGSAKTPPTTATVTVYRIVRDIRCSFSASAAFEQYAQKGPVWESMPHTMIAKCAEALALRKAFPRGLGGLYTGDEMEQADAQPTAQHQPSGQHDAPQASPIPERAAPAPSNESTYNRVPPTPEKPASDAQIKFVGNMVGSHVITEQERAKIMARMDRGMTVKEARAAIEWLQGEIVTRKAAEGDAQPEPPEYDGPQTMTQEEINLLDSSLVAETD